MRNSFKAILALTVTLPMLAFILGALIAAHGPDPDRSPILFDDPSLSPAATAGGGLGSSTGLDEQLGDGHHPSESASPGHGTESPTAEPEPVVVSPRPHLDDDDDWDDDGDEDDSDEDADDEEDDDDDDE